MSGHPDEGDGGVPPWFALAAAGQPPSDRALLGLPETGDLRSEQVEGALVRRGEDIARHALAGSFEAKRLAQLLVLAADRLQAEIARSGRGPLHPAAARRLAARMRASASQAAPVVRPAAVEKTAGIKVGSGLTAADLTEFDRMALALLVVSGGWNGKSARRLAMVADEHGISVKDLERIVLGLTAFLAEGEGLRAAMGEVGESAKSAWLDAPRENRADAAEGAVERVFHRINTVLRDEVAGDTRGSRLRLIGVFAIFGLSWLIALGLVFFGGGEDGAGGGTSSGELAPIAPPSAAVEPTSPAAASDVDANGKPVAPIAALAAPAKFPRPPGFRPSPTPEAIRFAASEGGRWVSELGVAAQDLGAMRGRLDDSSASRALLARVQDALARLSDVWPVDREIRSQGIAEFKVLARAARDKESLRRLMELPPGGPADRARAVAAAAPVWQRLWRNAFGAGCLASVACDPLQPPEVAAAAREELRLRTIAIPKGKVADGFGVVASEILAAEMPRLAEQIALGTVSLDDIARWHEAAMAASPSPEMRARTLVAAVDAMLRAPGALDKPGPFVDALAFFIQSLDFSGRGIEAEPLREALPKWLVDRQIPPTRIWVFTSLLDANPGVAWYGPDLVLATNADAAARAALAEKVGAAFPRIVATAAGEALLVEKAELDAWTALADEIRRTSPGIASERLRDAAIAMALLKVYRAFESGEDKAIRDAFTRLRQLHARSSQEWRAPAGGIERGLRSGSMDGMFVEQWKASADKKASRLDAVRALRSRPASGDLDPSDARLAVTEALRARRDDERAELAVVLIEQYSNGPTVLQALLDALPSATDTEDARAFVGAMAGATVAGRDWIAEARIALLRKLYLLEESEEAAIDAICAEMAADAQEIADSYGRTSGVLLASQPDRAFAALSDAIRAEAATRYLDEPFPATLEELERRRAGSRAVAEGVMQRMAAETRSMLDHAAILVVSRQPALRSKVAELLVAARRGRGDGRAASAQIELDLETLVAILAEGLSPKPTDRATRGQDGGGS